MSTTTCTARTAPDSTPHSAALSQPGLAGYPATGICQRDTFVGEAVFLVVHRALCPMDCLEVFAQADRLRLLLGDNAVA